MSVGNPKYAWELLQATRARLRQFADKYSAISKTKHKTFERDRAGEELEAAAIAYVHASLMWGLGADCAKPAGAAGDKWYEDNKPENILEMERRVDPRSKKKRRR